MRIIIDEKLKDYATDHGRTIIDTINKLGSYKLAAEELKLTAAGLRRYLTDIRRKAARHGYCPTNLLDGTAPPGYFVKGTTTYYHVDPKTGGKAPSAQWVKIEAGQEKKYRDLMNALADIAEPLRGQSPIAPLPQEAQTDLLTVYPLSDPHIGMYAWWKETDGRSFDLELAVDLYRRAVDSTVALAPPSDTGLIINLGDFFHSDNVLSRTARSGAVLDTDTRWAKVLTKGVKIMRYFIDQALTKHKRVHVINEIGNHDDHSAIMLSVVMAAYYENNPRVFIDTSPNRFHWYRFGANLLGVTHGHNVKTEQLPGIMAVDRQKDWGETNYRYWYTGHVHHDRLREFPGCIVETFRNLAPNDAWAHHSGYRSGSDIKCDVFHEKYGRIKRHIVGVEQLYDK